MLLDPIAVSKVNAEPLPNPSGNLEIDASKDVLTKVWQTQPSFALQGPPGTGKTTLIQAFADRLFKHDASAQVLIAAHSHHTVDDVRTKLNKLFASSTDRPIFIRLGGRDPSDDDVGPVTTSVLKQLAESELAKQSPPFITHRLSLAVKALKDGKENGLNEVRSMELLVQDAANMVFATLNSGDLADLVSKKRSAF